MNDQNLSVLQRRQAGRLGPRTAVRYKLAGLYHDLTWQRYLDLSLACGASLIDQGIQPGDRVGIWSDNRLGWLIADTGLLAAGAVNVPAHATLSAKQVHQQMAHAEVSWLFVANQAQYEQVRDFPRDVPTLKGIVRFDPTPAGDVPTFEAFVARGTQLLTSLRSELDRRCARLNREDLATIMYTSGTTGHPKGVMLTHGNLLTNALSMMKDCGVGEDSIVLSWLPYSHIYGRLVDHYLHLTSGCTLCLAESQETLIENLAETQPTNFAAVPRFYEKVLAAVSGGTKEEAHQRLRRIFGRRIQWVNSGGAPLPLHVAQAFVDAGLTMLQGYGLTETSPVISFNRVDSNRLGTVGPALDGVEIKIAPDGEVLTRGPHVMKGYWKDQKATDEMIKDGWLHTGDLGQIDADGYLSITGRKKELLVLSNGKKVVPPEVESVLLQDPCIDQAVLYGEGKHFVSALIVPNFGNLRAQLKPLGIEESENERLVANPKVVEFMQGRVNEALKDAASYEKVQKILLLPRPFTQEADELTVSLKLRRGIIFQRHKDRLEALYRS